MVPPPQPPYLPQILQLPHPTPPDRFNYVYGGDYDEVVPPNVTTVIVAHDVAIIRYRAFRGRLRLVSVVMEDTTTVIEPEAFYGCTALKRIRFSRKLTHIGKQSFHGCTSFKVLFLPRSLSRVGDHAFMNCENMELCVLLSKNTNPVLIGEEIIEGSKLGLVAKGVFEQAILMPVVPNNPMTSRSSSKRSKITHFLSHHMDVAPLHKLCLDPHVSTARLNAFFRHYGTASAGTQDATNGMLPLHILAMNPYVQDETFRLLHAAYPAATAQLDFYGKDVFYYAEEYNFHKERLALYLGAHMIYG